MRVRAQDANGDMIFGHSQQDFLINSIPAVAQIIETTLRLVLGEWYQDLSVGVPYLSGVLGYQNKDTADQTLISQVTALQWVTGLANWQSTIDPTTRKYSSVSATVYTQFGELQLQVDNLGVTQ